MSEKKKKIILICLLVFIFIFIYILNSKTLLVSDDFPYQFLFTGRSPSNTTKLISNPIDIFISMKNHWFLWGGRVTVHYALQFAFMLGVNFFNLVNSLMFVLLGWLIYKHINNQKKINLKLILFIYSMIFLFVPQPGSTIMWKSGSANYLWASVFILCMTLIYKNHYDNNKNIKDDFKNLILLFLFGLFVGCCNENSGCALIFTEFIFIVLYKSKYKQVPKWAISGLIGTIISYIFLLISPGNYIRADLMYPNVDYSLINIFGYILKITKLSGTYLFIPIIATIVTSVLIYNKKDNFNKLKEKYLMQITFLSFAFISIYSLVISPAYPKRSWMFAFVYLIIIIGLNLNHIDYKIEYLNKAYIITIAILLFYTISEYSNAYYTINNSYTDLKEQLNYINKQIKDGKKDITVSEVIGHEGKYNAFVDNGYISPDEDSWLNEWVAEYLGIDSIKTKD